MDASVQSFASRAAARLNLGKGFDGRWRGRCPSCGYAKPTLTMALEGDRIAISCQACGETARIAAAMGLPSDLVVAPHPSASKVTKALEMWTRAAPAPG